MTSPKRASTSRVVHAGDAVTYHGADGDRSLKVLQFGAGYADLVEDDGSVVYGVREGPATGQWSR